MWVTTAVNVLIVAKLSASQTQSSKILNATLTGTGLQTPSNACIWNANTQESSFVNGLYTYVGESQGHKDYYELQVASTCHPNANPLYLYESVYSTWLIAPEVDNPDPAATYLRCRISAPTTLNECNGNWEVPDETREESVTSTVARACPQTTCDTLRIGYGSVILPYEKCVGVFHRVTGTTNVYQKGSFDIFLYFHTSLFRWICGDGINYNCNGLENNNIIGYATEQSWHGADRLCSGGKKIYIPWSNNYTATVSCPSIGSHIVLNTSKLIILIAIFVFF